jgi:NADPH:quinone reductase-like Zn-dependent oxidoreductase
MRAIVQERYGPPETLELRQIEEPTVADDEVLVRVRAASLHPDIWHVVRGRPYVLRLMGNGLRKPRYRVPGTDMAGQVEAAGRAAMRFRPGDEVFGETLRGYQWRSGGAYAEYVAVPEEVLARKPAGIGFEQAAAVPTAGFIALANLRGEARIRPGQKVLVNGAGGGVGMLAVQIAKARGAEVTGVDGPEKLDLVRSLGADRALDHTREDFTRAGERYDLIFDVPGNHPFSAVRRALAPNGKYVLIGHDGFGAHGRRWLGSLPRFLGLMARAPFSRHLPALDFSTPSKQAAMSELSELIEAGRLAPVVDRTFTLAEVAAAIRYLESGRAVGRVVITVP